MAGFQVTINGRFWVTTEEFLPKLRLAEFPWARVKPTDSSASSQSSRSHTSRRSSANHIRYTHFNVSPAVSSHAGRPQSRILLRSRLNI
jgi:hypothetical protein